MPSALPIPGRPWPCAPSLAAVILALGAGGSTAGAAEPDLAAALAAAEPATVRERALAWMKAEEVQRADEHRTAPPLPGPRYSARGGDGLARGIAAGFKPRGTTIEDYETADGLRASRVTSPLGSYCLGALPVHTIMGERMREQGFTARPVPCPSR